MGSGAVKGLPFDVTVTPVPEDIEAEENSIAKADLFGEHLLDGCMTMMISIPPQTTHSPAICAS